MTNTQHSLMKSTEVLLRYLKINFDIRTLKKQLSEDPDFPSLATVSHLLSDYYIANAVLKIKSDDLAEVEYPALAELKNNFVMVESIQDGQISYYDPEKGRKKESLEKFNEKWNGILLIVAADEDSGDPEYDLHRKRSRSEALRMPFIWLGLAGLIFFAVFAGFSTTAIGWEVWLPLLILKLAGAVVAIFLLMTGEFKTDNAFVQSICTTNDKSGCGIVLNSKAAKLTSWLSLTELGLFYFAGGHLVLCLSLLAGNLLFTIWALGILTILTLPYSLFSIFYQAFKIKVWCRLCIAIQLLFWLEFLILALAYPYAVPVVDIAALGILFFSFALPVLLWIGFKPALLTQQENLVLTHALQRYRKDSTLFEMVLDRGPRVKDTPFEHELVLGNPDARHRLIIITNPFCGPCIAAHKEFHRLEAEFGEEVAFIIRFTGSKNDDDIVNQVIRHILALRIYQGNELALEALGAWYIAKNKKHITLWQQKCPINQSVDAIKIKAVHQEHIAWTQLAGIEGTPSFFVNGTLFPTALFELKDIRYYFREKLD